MLKLKNFQNEGVYKLLQKRRHILADEMGLGKTAQAVSATKWVPGIGKWLIVAPKTLGRVWANEVKKWAPSEEVCILKGTRGEKCIQAMTTTAKFIVVNYESLYSLLDFFNLQNIDWAGFIFDEAHKLKSRKSKMHRAASELMQLYPDKYCFCLSGTPIMNRAEELWSMLHMIRPLEFTNFHSWAAYNLKEDTKYIAGKGWIRQYNVPRNVEAFKDMTLQYVTRRLRKDCVELPPKTTVFMDVELEGEQLAHYESMRDAYFMEWESVEAEGRQVTATAMIAAITRMKQIAISTDILKDKDNPYAKTKPLSGAKIDAMEELIEEAIESGQKVVVFSQFATVLQRLYNQFKYTWNCAVMTGENSADQRDAAIEGIQGGDAQVLFLGTQVGGVGITLTDASVCIFLDLMWTPASNNQAADRIYRMGQEKPVTIYFIKAVDTIEDYILGLLAEKEVLFESIMPEGSEDNLANKLIGDWRSLLKAK